MNLDKTNTMTLFIISTLLVIASSIGAYLTKKEADRFEKWVKRY